MFVEGDIEIKIKDRAATGLSEHDAKLWLQRSFKEMCCYRISGFKQVSDKVIKATVALKTDPLPENERKMLESHGENVGALRTFIEKMFEGKGTCRAVGEPKLRAN
jgi:hypothetical protein